MALFRPAFNHTIGIEGGYVNDPDDPGGETKYGISKRSYPETDIKNLTLAEARHIYQCDFWYRLSLQQVDNQAIASELFDTAVNCGKAKAAEIIQRSLNMVGGHSTRRVNVDCIIGSKTIQAINSCQYPEALLKSMNGFQFEHYMKIVQRDITQRKWFRGWLRRVWEDHPEM